MKDSPSQGFFNEVAHVSCRVGEVVKVICWKIEWIKGLTKRVELDRVRKFKSSQKKFPIKPINFSAK
tara:strand:+ start:446 stop:646 length:201 start_codon:yes stop_codon:yes gene_type:complete